MSLNRITRFHPVVLGALCLFFILQVAAGFFHFSLIDRLLTSGLICAVAFAVTVFELWRLEEGEKNA